MACTLPKTTPPDETLRLAFVDEDTSEVWYGEGTLTALGIVGWNTWLVSARAPDILIVYHGGTVGLACARNSNMRHITWMELDGVTLDWVIQTSRSTDGGVTWEAPIEVYRAIARTDNIRIMGGPDGTLYIVFIKVYEDEVKVYRSDDQGLSWALVATLSGYYECDIQVDCDGDVWVSAGDTVVFEEIWVYRSADRGDTWDPPFSITPLPPVPTKYVDYHKLEMSSSVEGLHCIARGDVPTLWNNYPVHWATFDGGATVTTPPGLIEARSVPFFGGIWQAYTFSGDNLYLFWWDDADIFRFSHSLNLGTEWVWNPSQAVWAPPPVNIDTSEQGAQGCLIVGEIVCGIYTGERNNPDRNIGAWITDDEGTTWVQDKFHPYPPGSDYMQASVATYFTPAVLVRRATVRYCHA